MYLVGRTSGSGVEDHAVNFQGVNVLPSKIQGCGYRYGTVSVVGNATGTENLWSTVPYPWLYTLQIRNCISNVK